MITHDLWDIWNFVSNYYLHTKWIITWLAFRNPVEHPGVFAETVVLELKGWFHIFGMCQGRFTHYIGDGEPSHLENRESENKWVYIYIPLLGWWTVDDHPPWMLWGPVHEESPPRPKRPWLLQLLMRLLSSFNVRFCFVFLLQEPKKAWQLQDTNVFLLLFTMYLFFDQLNTKATDWGLICLCVYIFI